MASNAPQLPSRFPCWCRAVYSWGGQAKGDLGFIEGDLIECLNAGDGQWWMGRLRRDRRAVGLFPSNFVELMSEDFVPISRDTSQVIQTGSSPINNPTSAPKKHKTVFRKPFQAHKEALSPSSELYKSRTGTTSQKSLIPATPPRDGGGVHRSVKPLRTHATAVKNQSGSSSRPSSVSPRPSSHGTSPRASVDPETSPSTMLSRNSFSSSRPSSREVSPMQLQDVSPIHLHNRRSMIEDRSQYQIPNRSPLQHIEDRERSPLQFHQRARSPMPHERARSSMDYQERARSPMPHERARSPMPYERARSPMPHERARSPMPYDRARSPMPHERARSPMPYDRARSPMPHERARSPMPYDRARSPMPHERARSPMPYDRARSPMPHERARSPMPYDRARSPMPHERARSPMPYDRARSPMPHERARSPIPQEFQEREESPPPPPPPHRVAINTVSSRPPRQSHSPAPLNMNDRYVALARTPSPSARSARSDMNGNTPSPLRDAMEDVMTSLEDMGLPRQPPSSFPQRAHSPSFNNPWSGNGYDDDKTPPGNRRRPTTSMGFDGHKDHHRGGRGNVYSHDHYMDGPPQLNNYVQRMESRLRQLEDQNRPDNDAVGGQAPPPPPKHSRYNTRHDSIPHLQTRRSNQDFRGDSLSRSFTNKSSATSSSGVQSIGTQLTTSTDKTSKSLMSGISAGGFSAKSAGSYARRNGGHVRPNTAMDTFRSRGFDDADDMDRPLTPMTGVSYHSSHNTSRQGASSAIPWSSTDQDVGDSVGVFGGLSTPKTKKQGFFKKIFDSAKTGAASARSSISAGRAGSSSPTKGNRTIDVASPLTPRSNRGTSRDLGHDSKIGWVKVRQDVIRASSPSRNERIERAERCQMMDHPVIYSVEELYVTAEGDESIDGLPIGEPTNFNFPNLTLVDKSARFISNIPPTTNPISLAQTHICRPYKSDVQRLRAIFTWVSEKISWEEPGDDLEVDLARVLQAKRGSPEEIAVLVSEMCTAVGLHAEIIHGYLKSPGEALDLDSLSHPNHWWNAVLVDGEWRFMDCALANPTNPQRTKFVTSNSSQAESWYFLTRPLDICYTHVPMYPEEQHICPPISPDVLLALPPVCPQFFKLNAQFPDYDTSLIRIDGLECLQICLVVPSDVECAAEVESPAFARDADGDCFESGDIVRKRALVQPDWFRGQKRVTIKAVLPGDEGQGVLKVYAGKKGLMHSNKDIPHPLALALPIFHTGENPPYDFVVRHPTPHAQRHDLYIMQPQCARLAVNNTYIFNVRQHPASPPTLPKDEYPNNERASPLAVIRPASALSMISSTAGVSTVSSGSNEFSISTSAISSTKSAGGREKPAKLAIQSPAGKILRLIRKADHMMANDNQSDSVADGTAEGSVWETVIKIGERGTWRGLVLADRVARWCVFCEWECV
ncbi:hypothetical protein N7495_001251 [Penicillium taxi]|uniref:uncharacterized protein n=1 Tax=Penicillium taxi TaxID=168475 RepID=UPI0025459AD9|nr:uncharacterized protein N7495_001251 [Penicillium taxi]KAJ5908569.1 hypothetical protein N7495_001251 [Penicillium taxi]